MRFFRRGQGGDGGDLEGFWAWWAGARDRVATAISEGTVVSLADEISSQVRRLDRRLAWELAPGATAQHAMIVTPEGDPETRPLAIAWLAAAPPPDATWEYHASRQPGPLRVLETGGATADLSDVRAIVSWDETRNLLDVRLWHPVFPGVPEQVRNQVAFLFLDNLLGEDDVERWVGNIETSDLDSGGRTPDELRDEVRRRAASVTDDAWVLAERTDARGEKAIVSANAPLKRIDHPLASHHLCVTVDRGLEQLAGSPDLKELDAAEEELMAELQGVATAAGRVTERRRRRIHFVTADAAAANDVAGRWAGRYERFGPRVEVKSDPRWEFRRHLLG